MKTVAFTTVAVAVLWASGPPHANSDDAFDRKLIGFAEAAKSAARARDFSAVERIRAERLAMLSDGDGDSPWRAGAAAIGEAGKRIDRLDYRGACETLRAAWRPFGSPAAAASPAGVLGDVAMKLFEATQAALAFHPRCLDDGNPERIATRDELRAALRIAVDRDPCAVEARAALAFLTRPEPKEAFLRAEARPSVQARNRLIGEIAYESAGPVMPWHAPVELLKAGNLAFVLDDLDFCRAMLDRGPGSRIKGWDARHRPFDVLPNSHLLMRLGDEEGVEAPSVLFLASRGAASRGSKAEWRKLDLHLCEIVDGRLPAPASQAGDAARRPSVGRAASDHRLGPFRLRLVRQPSGLTADSVETLPVLAVDSLKRLEAAIEDAEKALAKNPAVPPAVLMPAEAVLHAGADVVRPPQRMGRLLVAAVDLDALARRGTLLVAAQASKPVAEPPFCQLGDGAGGEGARSVDGLPFLRVGDGSQLEIDADRRLMAIRSPRGRVVLPLDATAIPPALVVATDDGRAIEQVLVAAGYAEADASKEMLKVLSDPAYTPSKLAGKPITPETRGRVQRLRSLLAGIRYLEDARGTLVVARGTLGPAVGPALGPALVDERLVRLFASGGEQTDRDTSFPVADVQSLYASIVGDFLPKAVRLAPSAAMWRAFDKELARTPPAGSASGWTAHASLDATLDNPWKTGPAAPAAVAPTVSEAPAPPESSEIASSMQPAFWALEREAHRPQRLTRRSLERDSVSGIVSASDVPYLSLGTLELPPATAAQPPAAPGTPPARDTLLALAYAQAGADAVAGRYHRAIVGYHELLAHLRAKSLPTVITGSAADEAGRARFGEDLTAFVRDTRTEAIVCVELAAVLRAAGQGDAAAFVEQTLRDRLELVVVPLIEAAIDRARARGEREPPEVREALGRIASLVTARQDAAAAPHVSDAFRAADGKESIKDWLDSKKRTPEAAIDGLPLAITCPRGALGLDWSAGPLETLVAETDGETLTAWAALDPSRQVADQQAGRHLFLLGWYWLEQNRTSHAGAAFASAARVFAGQAGDGGSAEALVAMRNAIAMMVAATAVAEPPPGAVAAGPRAFDALDALATSWKHKARAAGLPADAVAAEHDAIVDMIGLVRRLTLDRDRAGATDRYFFFDSRYSHGTLPDVAVDAATETVKAAWADWTKKNQENEAAAKKAKEQQPPAPPPPPIPPPTPPEWPGFLVERFKAPSVPNPDVLRLRE